MARWTSMSQLDRLKEQLAYLKFWLGIVVVTDISLIGWFISSAGSADALTALLAAVGVVLLSCGIAFLHRRIERRIEEIGAL